MRLSLLALGLMALPLGAQAETTAIDVSVLPGRTVHEVATMTPLAMTSAGAPAMLLLDVPAGATVPPHATTSGLRILTVLSGDMSWGDGDSADPADEVVYHPGSVITIPAGAMHWLAAHNGPVRIQLVLLNDAAPVPGIQDQMK